MADAIPADPVPTTTEPAKPVAKGHKLLGEFAATAICGNDITSSCLYVSALAIIVAGRWAVVSLLIVALVLLLYRKVYAEVVGALPLNGGAYNALLNTTSKRTASLAACLTLLSYMATAVISAIEASHYGLHAIDLIFGVHGDFGIIVLLATVGLLALFMALTIFGIGESAIVAIVIFCMHIGTLTVLAVVAFAYIAINGVDLAAVFGGPNIVFYETTGQWEVPGIAKAIFFGFAASMLGISGFESSSNFVEEQKPGVFPKTLRNMWIAVSVFNPLMALLVLATISIGTTVIHRETLLAHLGQVVGGKWLALLVSVSATLVLCGAVLTSFVGVTGLIRRMTLDRCLPQFLLKENDWRGTSHRIIIAFFLLTVSILWITQGPDQLNNLAGVYTISFLSVMALFGIGNVLLKVRRARLPRPERAPWPGVLLAILGVGLGIVGQIILYPKYFRVFLIYFIPAMVFILIMLGRIGILKALLYFVRAFSDAVGRFMGTVSTRIHRGMGRITSQQVVFFTRGDSIANLNAAMLYVRKNEHTNRVKVVTVVQDPSEVPDRLEPDLKFLDEAYPEVDIEFVVLEDEFGPELILRLSKQWDIPTNFMFIGSPGDHFPYQLAELGGVRLII